MSPSSARVTLRAEEGVSSTVRHNRGENVMAPFVATICPNLWAGPDPSPFRSRERRVVQGDSNVIFRSRPACAPARVITAGGQFE